MVGQAVVFFLGLLAWDFDGAEVSEAFAPEYKAEEVYEIATQLSPKSR